MTFSEDFRDYLIAQASITNYVGTGTSSRIRPSKLDQRDVMPAIRFIVTSGESHEDLLGPVGLRQPNMQVDCYGNTAFEAEKLADEVREALQGYRGAMGDSFVSGISLVNRFQLFERPVDARDEGKHREVLVFDIVHNETGD